MIVRESSARAPDAGCAYAVRCPVALARCRSERPRLEPLTEGRAASCFRKAEVAAARVEA